LARCSAVLDRSGVSISGSTTPHQTLQILGMADREVQLSHPDVIFLAEAFTRPKTDEGPRQAWFTQSYTYFTWRPRTGSWSSI
jgi:starch synthase (maltosyl-transferring)